MFPKGFDACARVEETTLCGECTVSVHKAVFMDQHRRFAGEDFPKGVPILNLGSLVTPEHIIALSSQGYSTLCVFRPLRIGIISTGKEVVSPSTELQAGQIYNSNAPYLQTALNAWGYKVASVDAVGDDAHHLENLLASKHDFDVIISTGAVSKGKYDFVAESLRKIGANITFHGVRVRPGHPMLFATLGKTAYFGLPGNPGAVAACLRFFVEPFLRMLTRRELEKPITARMLNSAKKPGHVRAYYKARLTFPDGIAIVEMLPGQQSGMTRPLLEANAWALLEEGKDVFESGAHVLVYYLHPQIHDFSYPRYP